MTEFLGGRAIIFVYYLFTFFGIEAALAIAWGQWRRSDSFRARRLMVAFGGLTILRVMLFFVVLVGRDTSDDIASAFERVLALTSLGFLLWGFTPLFREKGSAGTVLLVVNTVFAFISYLLAITFWQGIDFNQSPWEVFFVIWQIGLVAFGAVNCAMKLDDERTFALFGFVILLVGYLAHIFSAASYPIPDDPLWVRMAELIAYPLFAVAVYQGAILSLSARSEELKNLSEMSLDRIKGLIALFEATRQISSSLEVSNVLDGATQSMTKALGADLAAIALPEDGEDLSQLRLISIYNPSRKGRGEAVSFPLNEQQVIKHALKRKYQVQVDEYQDNSQIRMLFALMGAKEVGPLLVQPLLLAEEPMGVMIIGNPISKRVFTESEEELSKSLASQISVAISHAREHAATSNQREQLSWTLRNQELESGKRQAAMETELKKSREEVTIFAQRLHQLEAAAETDKETLKQAQERIAKLDKAIERAKIEVEKSRQKDKDIEQLTGEKETYTQQLAELQAEKQGVFEKVELLEQEAAEIPRLKESLEQSNQRSRKLARALKRARTHTQQVAPVPTLIGEPGSHTQLEDLSCGVIISDANGKISQANAAASHMLDRKNNHLVNSELAHMVEDQRWQEAVERLKNGNEATITTTLQVSDNTLRATISPMAAVSDKDTEGTVTILYDITTEAESQQARDEFVASLSQELRTPMTSITGYTDLLLGESVGIIGEMQRKFLQRIKANIERMGSMLSDLIGVTAIDAGQLEIRPVVIDIAEVIEDAMITARAQLEENELAIEVHLMDDMPLIEVDPEAIRQIMNNLLGNAIKASLSGNTITVSASVNQDDVLEGEELGFLQLSIRDAGGGIAQKDIERVFDRFYQAERPLIEGLGETGVGLAIAKSLIEAHGGRIWVESEIGEGTTFHFLLNISHQSNDPWLEVDIPPLDLNTDHPDVL